MPVHNRDIAQTFDQLADLLEIADANPFRVRAYRNAARSLRASGRNVADMLAEGCDLSELPDIGEDLAAKIKEIVETGHLTLLEEVAQDVPRGLADVVALPGIGPKRARSLHEALGITSLDDLQRAAEDGRIAEVKGFGAKTQRRILDAVTRGKTRERRFRLDVAEDYAAPLLEYIRDLEGVKKAEIAGSYRRRKDTVGDLDIVAAGSDGTKGIAGFIAYDEVARVVSRGETRSTVILRSGLQVDLRIVAPESFGAALHYFTGSKAHSIACRRRAKGLRMNEYGLFRGDKRQASNSETEIYDALGLPWIAPVLREDRGEIEAADAGALPDLVRLEDIRGDLHMHTTASDGRNSLREMAQAAQERGYEYIAITDHSRSQTVAGGLSVEDLEAQLDDIDALNDTLEGLCVLKSSEVDILRDGTLDYPDDLLAKLDLVVASVHAGLDLDEDAQTERIIRAMDNPHVGIIGHPTGRLINARPAAAVDLERLIEAALERGCFLEINASPHRLDLDDVACRLARDAGLALSIGTDAHAVSGLDDMRFGIGQAQRGWLGPDDVLNTRGLNDLRDLLKRA